MGKSWKDLDREQLLADIAEMYYEEGHTQQEIAQAVGLTRSAVSRLLNEAQEKGVLEIRIHRPLRFDHTLGDALAARFRLQQAYVVAWRPGPEGKLKAQLGLAAARALTEMLPPGGSLGISWGTTLKAVVDGLADAPLQAGRVVQLIGAMGARDVAYDAHALVSKVVSFCGCEGIYLHAPFLVESAEVAASLRSHPSLRTSLEAARSCDVALVGAGTANPESSSLYLGGHIPLRELNALRAAGAVGDSGGYHYDRSGTAVAADFHNRLVGISREDLLHIPQRLVVAGGLAKVEALLGALRGGYATVLVTDSGAAAELLRISAAERHMH